MSLNRTLTVMKSNVGNAVGDTSSSMASLIQNYINDRYTEVLRRTKLLQIHRNDYSFTTTAGTEDYVLPQDFDTELSVIDKTNGRQLARLDIQQVTDNYAAQIDQQGVVSHYIVLDKRVNAQPTSASGLSVVSSSASDTTQTVFVKGIDSNGVEDYETLTLTGTTPVATTKTYAHILSIGKSAVTAGYVTITSNSGAVTNAVMNRQDLEYRIKVMRLVQVPSGAILVELNYIQGLRPLTQDYDSPVIDCADVLEQGAIADAWRHKRQYEKAADHEINFEKRLANLIFNYESQPNKVNLFNVQPYRREFESGGNVDDARRYGVY